MKNAETDRKKKTNRESGGIRGLERKKIRKKRESRKRCRNEKIKREEFDNIRNILLLMKTDCV